jgi:hypothetical protein
MGRLRQQEMTWEAATHNRWQQISNTMGRLRQQEMTWEAATNFSSTKPMLDDYKAQHGFGENKI